MNNTLQVNNSVLKDYFDVVGILPRKQYLNRYNTNIANEGGTNFITLITSVNDHMDTIWKHSIDHNSIGSNKFKFSFNVNSNEMKDYLEIFDKNENSNLSIHINNNNENMVKGITISDNKANLELTAVNEIEFTYPTGETRKTEVYMNANHFINGVENIVKSIAKNETHMPTICNISIKVDKANNTIELAGIDGFRLHTKIINVPNIYRENEETEETEETEQFLISKCSVESMVKMIKKIKTLRKKDFDQDLLLSFTENNVYCHSNGYCLTSKLEKGNFFEYEAIELREDDKKIKFTTNRDNLLKELKRLSKVKGDKNNLVKMDITKDQIYLTSENETACLNIEYNDIKNYEGEELTIGFNTKYLIEALEKLDKNQEIKLSFDRSIDPVQIEYTDKNNNSGLNEVLPVRLTH